MARPQVAIVGVAESDEMGKLPHKSAFALHAEAARNALADAGLTKNDVDATFSAGTWMASETAEYMGIRPRYVDGTQIGGCSFIAHVEHAMAAIEAGLCEVALITHGESGASRIAMPGTRFGLDSTRMQFENPFGLAGPPTGYALAAARHMHEFGTTSEQLAEGPRLMTNLVGIEPDPAKIRIGMPVEVVFEDVSAEIALPRFRPVGA